MRLRVSRLVRLQSRFRRRHKLADRTLMAGGTRLVKRDVLLERPGFGEGRIADGADVLLLP